MQLAFAKAQSSYLRTQWQRAYDSDNYADVTFVIGSESTPKDDLVHVKGIKSVFSIPSTFFAIHLFPQQDQLLATAPNTSKPSETSVTTDVTDADAKISKDSVDSARPAPAADTTDTKTELKTDENGSSNSSKSSEKHKPCLQVPLVSFDGGMTVFREYEVSVLAFDFIKKFLYGLGELALNGTNIIEVLFAARKYRIEALINTCTEYLKKSASVDNILLLIKTHSSSSNSTSYKLDETLKQVLVSTLALPEHCNKIINSEQWFSLPADMIAEAILQNDNLAIEENVLFQKCVEYSQHVCLNSADLVWTDVMKQHFVKYIRFPTMQNKFFVQTVAKSGVLTKDEIIDVTLYKLDPDHGSSCFNTETRVFVQRKIEQAKAAVIHRSHRRETSLMSAETRVHVMKSSTRGARVLGVPSSHYFNIPFELSTSSNSELGDLSGVTLNNSYINCVDNCNLDEIICGGVGADGDLSWIQATFSTAGEVYVHCVEIGCPNALLKLLSGDDDDLASNAIFGNNKKFLQYWDKLANKWVDIVNLPKFNFDERKTFIIAKSTSAVRIICKPEPLETVELEEELKSDVLENGISSDHESKYSNLIAVGSLIFFSKSEAGNYPVHALYGNNIGPVLRQQQQQYQRAVRKMVAKDYDSLKKLATTRSLLHYDVTVKPGSKYKFFDTLPAFATVANTCLKQPIATSWKLEGWIQLTLPEASNVEYIQFGMHFAPDTHTAEWPFVKDDMVGRRIEYSTDGQTWTPLGSIGGPCSYTQTYFSLMDVSLLNKQVGHIRMCFDKNKGGALAAGCVRVFSNLNNIYMSQSETSEKSEGSSNVYRSFVKKHRVPYQLNLQSNQLSIGSDNRPTYATLSNYKTFNVHVNNGFRTNSVYTNGTCDPYGVEFVFDDPRQIATVIIAKMRSYRTDWDECMLQYKNEADPNLKSWTTIINFMSWGFRSYANQLCTCAFDINVTATHLRIVKGLRHYGGNNYSPYISMAHFLCLEMSLPRELAPNAPLIGFKENYTLSMSSEGTALTSNINKAVTLMNDNLSQYCHTLDTSTRHAQEFEKKKIAANSAATAASAASAASAADVEIIEDMESIDGDSSCQEDEMKIHDDDTFEWIQATFEISEKSNKYPIITGIEIGPQQGQYSAFNQAKLQIQYKTGTMSERDTKWKTMETIQLNLKGNFVHYFDILLYQPIAAIRVCNPNGSGEKITIGCLRFFSNASTSVNISQT